jgi:hypothetical protein
VIHRYRLVVEVETDAPANLAAEAMARHGEQPIFTYDVKDISETAYVYVDTVETLQVGA